ncbi:MAG: DNA topoisomerase IB [Microbacterium sp.]|uniref:DNA topoisomerase IB n=1 Tax=Microbacterium sp. TaxID=51671 RepID=UPI001DFF34F0|nr:DNA topoisomerase IB [Microbacterium sp.]MBW8764606.1 DNA topoisomerase IB [Microbacterium sp.]
MRLRRSDSARPGIARIPLGDGFSYRDAAGATIADPEQLDRIVRLAIPPAWGDVWISPHHNGHIQATGVDAVGRRQYLYHPAWREQKDRLKFDRMLAFAEALPAARRGVTRDLRRNDLSRERVLAGAFRLLDSAALRVGSERYVDENGTFGLATLLCSHADVDASVVRLSFPAKSGRDWSSELRDRDLAALLGALTQREPDDRLLAWEGDGSWHPVSSAEINDDLRRRTGGPFSAKDFRTLRGTAAAALSLARSGPQATKIARRRAIAEAIAAAAEVLENTPAIARSSYIDPRLIDRYEHGETIDASRPRSVEAQLLVLLSS